MLIGMDSPVTLLEQTEAGRVRTTEVRLESNPIAAMPSIHFAATAVVAWAAYRCGAILSGVALLYTVLMGIALVYLGEHYVLDLIVGGALAGTGWRLAGGCIDAGEGA